MTRMTRFAVTLVVTAGGLLATRGASAQDAGTVPTCASLTNPVYVTGSSAFEATLEAFAVKLMAAGETTPMTIVNLRPGSCAGVNTIAMNADLTGTANSYHLDSSGKFVRDNCTLPTTGQKADLAVSDVFYGSCGTAAPATQPATLKDFPGPVQAIEFVVNKTNTATAYITAAEAQDLYGCGASAAISTFTQATGIFCRDSSSGTQVMLCDNIGLAANIPAPPICVSVSGTAMPTSVAGYATPAAAVGMLSADNYDLNRNMLGALAFEAFGQTKAYYTDSTSTSHDRQNVRDGHYSIWGYEHMFTYVDSAGKPTSANAARLINVINGVVTDAAVGDYVTVEATAGTIPVCAMGVKKTDDLPGYMSPATPTCSCAFVKAATGTAPTGCVPCGGASDGGADAAASGCTGGKTCHSGFCE